MGKLKDKGLSEQEAIIKGLKFTKPVTGIVLMNAVNDSNGNPINSSKFYHVAKDKSTGKIAIVPVDETEKPN